MNSATSRILSVLLLICITTSLLSVIIDVYKRQRFIGRKMRVLVDGKGKREGWLTGKSSEFIIVEFEGDESLTGSFADVEIIGAKNWAVTGKLIEKKEK